MTSDTPGNLSVPDFPEYLTPLYQNWKQSGECLRQQRGDWPAEAATDKCAPEGSVSGNFTQRSACNAQECRRASRGWYLAACASNFNLVGLHLIIQARAPVLKFLHHIGISERLNLVQGACGYTACVVSYMSPGQCLPLPKTTGRTGAS